MSDLQHALLRDPERARAFELIVTGKPSTLRAFADLLGWTLPRVQRFVNTIEREQLAKVHRSRWGTSLTRYTPDTHPIQPQGAPADTQPIRSRHAADTQPIRLGSKALDQLPRSRAGNDFIADLIDGMNRSLSERFGEEYRIVLYDNRSSEKSARRLQKLGVTVDWAVTELWKDVQMFHPDKHGNGHLPRSLAYFEKGLAKKWAEWDQLLAAPLVTSIEKRPAMSAVSPIAPQSDDDRNLMQRFRAKREARDRATTLKPPQPIGSAVVAVVKMSRGS